MMFAHYRSPDAKFDLIRGDAVNDARHLDRGSHLLDWELIDAALAVAIMLVQCAFACCAPRLKEQL
jgi:hypothetical protein